MSSQLHVIHNLEKILEYAMTHPYVNNILISGAPGIGKSEITYQVAERLNKKILEVRLYEEGEAAVGLPILNGKITQFSKPWWFHELDTGDYDVLFLDDFHKVPHALQQYLYKLLTHRMLHNYKLKRPIKIILAGNFNIQTASSCEIESPIMSRFHLAVEYQPTIEELRDWLVYSGRFDTRIVGFLNVFPQFLYTQDPPETEMYPNLRSWENLSKQIEITEDAYKMAPAIVGLDAGAKLVEYWKYTSIKLEDILDRNPDTLEQVELYAYIVSLSMHTVEAVRNKNRKVLETTVRYVDQHFVHQNKLEPLYFYIMLVFNSFRDATGKMDNGKAKYLMSIFTQLSPEINRRIIDLFQIVSG